MHRSNHSRGLSHHLFVRFSYGRRGYESLRHMYLYLVLRDSSHFYHIILFSIAQLYSQSRKNATRAGTNFQHFYIIITILNVTIYIKRNFYSNENKPCFIRAL